MESYALEYSVSQAEAIRRLGRIEAIREALASIRGLESARVAGWDIDHRGRFGGWVLLTGNGPASTAAAAVADAHSDVEIRTGAQHSYTELQAAQRGLSEDLIAGELSSAGSGAVGNTGQGTQAAPGMPSEPGAPGETEEGGLEAGVAQVVTFLGTDMAGNAVRVGIDPGLAPEVGPLGSVSELSFDQSAAKVAELLQDHISVQFTVDDGRGLADTTSFHGGEEVSSSSSSCTSGFAARRNSDGIYGIITAGHCGDPGPNDTTSFSMREVSLPFVYGWASATADAQFNRIPTPTSGSHYVQDDYLCREIVSYPNPYCEVTTDIARADMQGDFVCHTGASTKFSCGKVTDINFTYMYVVSGTNPCLDSNGAGTPCSSVFVEMRGTYLKACVGDSGGPVYRGGKAYGIVKSTFDVYNCTSGGKRVIFSAIREVKEFLGVEVLTEPITLNAS